MMTKKNYFKNILVPVDGSTSCFYAKQLAASIAKIFQSKVKVIHVVSHDFMHPELKAHHQLPPLILTELDNVYLKSSGNCTQFFHQDSSFTEVINSCF